ncbi:monovalent cation/H(+) antiporter subunit G [Paenibacillus sp.]|uniref:monovalent cation/H(+) antiporter subunit G n=1 Tax=Paenibacillus sp. TaxID=58172 RepID=UPI002D473105|nr:monovalent cation/H(+) antiporter subunit G [Paenibacillus sp.]HZG87024.1 monovalent cation/H(+) antiporter subunit G [Paenibacillus sp.]
MIETIQGAGEAIVAVLVLLGALLCAVSSFGLVRMPDVYLRSHAATKASTLGVLCILLAGFLFFLWFHGVASAKMLLAVAFVFATAPVAGHLIGRAAYRTGVPLSERSVQDDLAEALGPEGKVQPGD